jgi:hypothetical protein
MTIVISRDCAESGKLLGNVVVAAGGRLRLGGMIAGTLQVQTGGYAHVCGLVEGLVVEQGGSAQLDGMCAGNVFNMGGELTISGMVVGQLHGRMYTRIMPGSRIIAA